MRAGRLAARPCDRRDRTPRCGWRAGVLAGALKQCERVGRQPAIPVLCITECEREGDCQERHQVERERGPDCTIEQVTLWRTKRFQEHSALARFKHRRLPVPAGCRR